jgi:nucleoside-diphosphate-sugar epimerase
MTSLVTGATGLIGSHLVEQLVVRGDRVRALVRPTSDTQRLRELGVEIRVGSLMDNATMMSAAKGAGRVFHCAALVSDWGPYEAFEQANVQGVRSVLGAATRADVSRFVYLSTSDVYGFPGRPVDETEHLSPRGFPYSDTKVDAETLIWTHWRTVKLPVTVLRPATVYGPRAQLLVAGLLRALRRRKAFLIDGGAHIAGLAYVGNLVDAMILAADRDEAVGQAYNISDGTDVTWKAYLDGLADIAQVPRTSHNRSHDVAFAQATAWESWYRLRGRTDRPPFTRMMVELMGTDQSFPIDKAREQLGYRPRVDFAEGMRHTADWVHQSGLLEQR